MGRIVGPVLTVTLFSAGIVYAYEKGLPVTLSNSVTPLLAVVVSGPIFEFVVCDPHVMTLGWAYPSVQVSYGHRTCIQV